ncbi:LOG family protein [Siccirubricoccus sp. KC 17139]|uniref:AMP nucleosidase n=1 Tax=Siccirubricoccus soli TaxID=2899147 RepID=A0ABT1D8N9_9PROT|nr:LOG family protein [Siccirubricoccus soli]MCO6418318.1 LOG family protein [Siccirubricoccus soli]MCP2684453.1 LOG family protein [Siccirubricoccus soli]
MKIVQRDLPSYRLAVEDTDFLLRDEMRAFRFGMEYAKAELLLRDWGVRSTVVVFGSARIPAPEAAVPGTPLAHLSPWYGVAREFGRLVSERGGALAPETKGGHALRDNVIATGGGPGIMEAANRGAADVGAPSIGFNIVLPHEQMPNPYSTPELTFRFHYFAMRKMHLAMRANALAVFPGGFGTFDELFEILTLLQTKKAPPVAVVLFGREFWTEVVNFRALQRHGLVDEVDLSLFGLVDTAEEGWDWLTAHGLKAHTPPAERPG